jgi:hypothetical protein
VQDPAATIAALIDGAGAEPHAPAAGVVPLIGDDAVPSASREPRAMGFDVDAINADHAMVLMGSKAMIFKEQSFGPFADRVRFISVEAFQHLFRNRPTEVVGSDGKIRTITWAQAWLSHRYRRQYVGIEFFPNPDGAPGAPNYLNLWRGFAVEPSAEGSYAIFRDHLFNNVCNSNEALFDYLFAWFAHIVQRPRERVGTAIVLRGRMGTGKTKVGEVIGSLFPAHYFLVDDSRFIVGQFNAHMASCLLLQADEAVWAGDKTAEGRLKGLITSESQMIEQKGIDAFKVKNHVRLLMTSNETWVVPAGKDERRFCVLDVHPRCAQNHDYFREMDAQLDAGGRARLLYDLQRFDIAGINLRQIPKTSALFEQKLRSFDPLENWWYNRLMDGAIVRGGEGWPAVIPSEAIYSDYLHAAVEVGIGRKRDRSSFGLALTKLIPGLAKPRLRLEVEPGVTKRAWCYALPPLDTCRAAFEEMIGQAIEWPAISAGEDDAGVVPV